MRVVISKCLNTFNLAKLTRVAAVAAGIEKEINDFKRFLPIIRALCAEGLKERHIDMISAKLGQPAG
jgi:hypothetical protein